MRLGICGPIEIEPFRSWLKDAPENLPRGLGGTPVVDLARAALREGWEVVLFSLDPAVRHEMILKGPQLKICLGPFRPRHRARDLFRSERAYISDAVRKERPDIVHAHWTYEFALGAIDSGVPAVVTAHDAPLSILRLNPTPYRLLRTLMAWQVARRAPRLTAVSTFVAEHFHRYFGYRSAIPVIPNGLPNEWFRDEPGTANRAPHTVFASVLNGWGVLKNTKTLLRAFQLVRDSSPRSRLLLYGHGHGPGEDAEIWAQKRALCGNVRFCGAVDRAVLAEGLQSEAQVLVHPALEESFGMTIAEAMALGIPVIAGKDSGAVSTTLDGGQSGVLTDVRSPAILAAEMLRVGRSPELRAELARKGSASARGRFHMDKVLNAYAAVYREALEA
jgi:glycosyltransferase involved in cell wall biosynthesis